MFCIASQVIAKPTATSPLLLDVNNEISALLKEDWFSDEDAIQISIYFLERLIGKKTNEQKLEVYVTSSSAELISVVAGYSWKDVVSTRFEFTFWRGSKDEPAPRHAGFFSLKMVPSE